MGQPAGFQRGLCQVWAAMVGDAEEETNPTVPVSQPQLHIDARQSPSQRTLECIRQIIKQPVPNLLSQQDEPAARGAAQIGAHPIPRGRPAAASASAPPPSWSRSRRPHRGYSACRRGGWAGVGLGTVSTRQPLHHSAALTVLSCVVEQRRGGSWLASRHNMSPSHQRFTSRSMPDRFW